MADDLRTTHGGTPRALLDLAARYHRECEAYDLTVCTGPMGRDGILPANYHEAALINRNAWQVLARMKELARAAGFADKELWGAIGRHDPRAYP